MTPERATGPDVREEAVRESPPAGLRGKGPIRVVLLDQMTLVRQGVRVLLAGEGVEVAGEAATVDEAVRVAQGVHPDVVLMDGDLSDPAGTIRSIKAVAPQTHVLVLASDAGDLAIESVMNAGAAGYLLKNLPIGKMVAALRAVCGGNGLESQVVPPSSDRGAGLLLRRHRERSNSGPLTPRQLQILLEIARGESDREIAAHCGVVEGTVKTHIRHILETLGVRNRTEAVAYALRKGLIT